jgi:hypothetical protein
MYIILAGIVLMRMKEAAPVSERNYFCCFTSTLGALWGTFGDFCSSIIILSAPHQVRYQIHDVYLMYIIYFYHKTAGK